MKFSKKYPGKEGFYWHRYSLNHEPCVRKISIDPGDERLSVFEYDCGEFNFLENYEGEWAGPLIPPSL